MAAVEGRGRSDEELRQHLTVVSGYLSLLLEDRDRPPGPEHWTWLERADAAARAALELYESLDAEAEGGAGHARSEHGGDRPAG